MISISHSNGSLEERIFRTTIQGRYLIFDDEGNVCDALSLDSRTRCCPLKGERFSCQDIHDCI
ncbi:unnamed protein product [Brassica oleracea var. botrytis]|uniref:Uncharacterized protein n=2 Tax=Brassica oleracea TaxID=3712 RepID=A0A0D3BF11_BRAOL|nr:unnamed protein product [Brassica oleracea]